MDIVKREIDHTALSKPRTKNPQQMQYINNPQITFKYLTLMLLSRLNKSRNLAEVQREHYHTNTMR